MSNILLEYTRSELKSKAQKADTYIPSNQYLGKNRYERRVHSSMASSVREFNDMDMNKLFKQDILDVVVNVHGETNNYQVKMSFGGFLKNLQRRLENSEFNIRAIIRALIDCFNSNNVYIHCTCPDWKYRMDAWANIGQIGSNDRISSMEKPDDPMDRPAKITNPNNTKGPGCKHTLLLLTNTTWLIKVASVIHNYINYMEKHYKKLYADIIYPALYNKEYEDEVQLDFDTLNKTNLDSDKDTLDISNKWAATKDLFQKGNTKGIRFASNNSEDNKQIDFDHLISDS